MGSEGKLIDIMRIGTILSTAVFSVAILVSTAAQSQNTTHKPQAFPLWQFDEAEGTCRAKGRLQDKGYCVSKMMDEIVAQGKAAIPILISQLTDARETKRPIYDYWGQTTAGDIAYSVLNDLFKDSTGRPSICRAWRR
jgi:hypothetical protein